MKTYEQFVDHVYNLVRMDTENMDAIYGDYIVRIIGSYGFNALHDERLIEGCGVINGRALYTLCPKEPVELDKNYEELLAENKKLKEMIMKGI